MTTEKASTPFIRCHWSNRIEMNADEGQYQCHVRTEAGSIQLGTCDFRANRVERENWVEQLWWTMVSVTRGVDIHKIQILRPYEPQVPLTEEDKPQKPREAGEV